MEQKLRQGIGSLGIPEKTMPHTFDWDNFEDIAIGLTDKYPDTDPLTVRFTDMHKWITELEGFTGDPAKSNEAKLEAIQMAWNEEFQDRK
jgi:FeS assembly protein IscX